MLIERIILIQIAMRWWNSRYQYWKCYFIWKIQLSPVTTSTVHSFINEFRQKYQHPCSSQHSQSCPPSPLVPPDLFLFRHLRISPCVNLWECNQFESVNLASFDILKFGSGGINYNDLVVSDIIITANKYLYSRQLWFY